MDHYPNSFFLRPYSLLRELRDPAWICLVMGRPHLLRHSDSLHAFDINKPESTPVPKHKLRQLSELQYPQPKRSDLPCEGRVFGPYLLLAIRWVLGASLAGAFIPDSHGELGQQLLHYHAYENDRGQHSPSCFGHKGSIHLDYLSKYIVVNWSRLL